MEIREIVRKGIEPAARKLSAAITMRLVGYAIVRSVVGLEGLQKRPWAMSQTAVYDAERAFRRHFGMASSEFVAKYLEDAGVQEPEAVSEASR